MFISDREAVRKDFSTVWCFTMSKSRKALLVTLFTYLSFVQCHELLNDFLDFKDENFPSEITKKCADHLSAIKSGIEGNSVWALKGG